MEKTAAFRLIGRALLVWLIIVFAESLHGAARIIFLQPLVGDFRARQIAVFSAMLIILAISYVFIRWIRAVGNFQLLAVGGLWVVLTFMFEISLGRLMNLSWERIFSDYHIAHGGLMGFGLLFMFFAPLMTAKLKDRFSQKSRL